MFIFWALDKALRLFFGDDIVDTLQEPRSPRRRSPRRRR